MKDFNFIKNEHNMLKLWEEISLFEKIKAKNEKGKRFSFLDGPITANASMGVHHVWGRTLKDIVVKYNALKGHSQQYQWGFDAQGMWVEVEVEKLLGLNDKKAILEYGLDNFTEKCIERVNYFKDIQTRQSIRLGQLGDWDNSYVTNSDENIQAIWHFLKVVNDKGWLKKSYKAMPWCPRCGTSLSEHEMSGSYKEVTNKAVFVKLRLLDSDEDILIWTTTPWTLPANVAVAVNPHNTYVKVKVKSQKFPIIVGKEAIKKLRDDAVEVLEEFKGSELVGKKYLKLLGQHVLENPDKPPTIPFEIQTNTIIPWDEVSASEGSGLVHIAPGCGAEDFELGKIHNLEPIVPIDESGRFKDEFGVLAKLSTEEAAPVIFEILTKLGPMYYTHNYSHNYPFCWRCKTNVVFRLVDGWDIATKEVKPEIFKAIKTVKWQPVYLQKMMEDWITNMGDWNISRRRFYGLPLPFYPCEKCNYIHVVGSLDELRTLATNQADVDKVPHLHRPYIDEVKIKCPKCSVPVKRVSDVGDCWLDAGITPFSTKGYFTDKKSWEENFPIEIVVEGKEQIRLWFYSQLFMSVVLTGRAPYKTVMTHNMMLAEDGSKFSKTGPNVIRFDDAAETFGADAMRYAFAGAVPTHDMRFGKGMIKDTKRRLSSILNAVTFYNTYAAVDKPNLATHKPQDLHVTDIWLIESLNKYIKECDEAYKTYNLHYVVAKTDAFVEDICNFYIRTNRRRFWKGENSCDKLNAYWALFQALRGITIVIAPIATFLSEFIWKTIIQESESVLLATFPTPVKLNKTIPNTIEHVLFFQKVATLAHSLRAKEGLKVKQPLKTLYIKTDNIEAVEMFKDLLKEELNVKEIELVKSEDQFNIPYLVVNFRTAGKQLGGQVQELKAHLESMSENETKAMVELYEKGKEMTFAGKKLNVSQLFEKKLKSKPEFVSAVEDDVTIVLDTTLTEELTDEGLVRELIRAIQIMRQEAGFNISDRINLEIQLQEDSQMAKVIATHHKRIDEEVLTTDKENDGEMFTKEIEIGTEKMTVTIIGG